MFEELDRYIKEFEMEDFAVDYWYDEGATIAEDMLHKFKNHDWESLLHMLPNRTIGWKRRLAYCLHDSSDLKQLETLWEFIYPDFPAQGSVRKLSADDYMEIGKSIYHPKR